MKLSEFKSELENGRQLSFALPHGDFIPQHFHITEIGMTEKNFIDCGGTIRKDKKVSFQLWYDTDVDHRLTTEKLLGIIKIGETRLGIEDLDIEVEYQSSTIGKYGISTNGNGFSLTATQTDCLAKENCGIPVNKVRVALAEVGDSCCSPQSGCC